MTLYPQIIDKINNGLKLIRVYSKICIFYNAVWKNFFDYRCNNKDSLESFIKDAVKAEEVDQRVHKGQG